MELLTFPHKTMDNGVPTAAAALGAGRWAHCSPITESIKYCPPPYTAVVWSPSWPTTAASCGYFGCWLFLTSAGFLWPPEVVPPAPLPPAGERRGGKSPQVVLGRCWIVVFFGFWCCVCVCFVFWLFLYVCFQPRQLLVSLKTPGCLREGAQPHARIPGGSTGDSARR